MPSTGEFVIQRDGALSVLLPDARGMVWLRAPDPRAARKEVARFDVHLFFQALRFVAIPEPGIDRALVTTRAEVFDLRPKGGQQVPVADGLYNVRAAAVGPGADAFVLITDATHQEGHLYFGPAQAGGGWKEIAVLSDAACLAALRTAVVEQDGSFVALCGARPVERVSGVLVARAPVVDANVTAASSLRDPGGRALFFALASDGETTELLRIAHALDGTWSGESLLKIYEASGERPLIAAIDASRVVIHLSDSALEVRAREEGGPWMPEQLSLPGVTGTPGRVTSAGGDPPYLMVGSASGHLYWREDDGAWRAQFVGDASYERPDACPPTGSGCLCTAIVPSRGGQAPGGVLIVLLGGVLLGMLRRQRKHPASVTPPIRISR